MDGANRIFGIGGRVHFDGKDCTVHARDEEFYAVVDAEVVKRRGDPLERIQRLVSGAGGQELPPEQLRIMADSIFAAGRDYRNVTQMEHSAFMETWDGIALEIWYCLKHEFDATFTPKRVRYVLQESRRLAMNAGEVGFQLWLEWVGEIRRGIDSASGDDLLGNLTGFRLPVTAEAPPSDTSSAPSLTSTDSQSPKSES